MVAQVTVAICGNNSASNRFYSEWYCQRQSMGRSLVTSVLPTVLLMLWQNLFLPNALYRCAPRSFSGAGACKCNSEQAAWESWRKKGVDPVTACSALAETPSWLHLKLALCTLNPAA